MPKNQPRSFAKHYKQKRYKPLVDLITPYGYTLQPGKKHHRIVNQDGEFLAGVSSSPSDPNWYKNVVRVLIRGGHLPKGTRL